MRAAFMATGTLLTVAGAWLLGQFGSEWLLIASALMMYFGGLCAGVSAPDSFREPLGLGGEA